MTVLIVIIFAFDALRPFQPNNWGWLAPAWVEVAMPMAVSVLYTVWWIVGVRPHSKVVKDVLEIARNQID